jgi:hypothetical protein
MNNDLIDRVTDAAALVMASLMLLTNIQLTIEAIQTTTMARLYARVVQTAETRARLISHVRIGI